MQCCLLNRHRNFRILKVNDYIKRLEHSGIQNAKQEALWLMSHALGVSHSEIFAHPEFSPYEQSVINAAISRRENGEPLQYILGTEDFYGRSFSVGHGVLIPRHDTETLIEGVKKCFNHDDDFKFLDWGTGSGCIAVTLLLEFPKSYGYMLDISNDALKYARENLSRYNLFNRSEIISRINSAYIDLIISNPPYITSGEIQGLMREVKDYEPHSALDGGSDGMKYYREIFDIAVKILKPKGYIIFETGNINQVNEIEKMNNNFEAYCRIFDDGNFPRCLVLRRE